jgi:hypothetical protein
MAGSGQLPLALCAPISVAHQCSKAGPVRMRGAGWTQRVTQRDGRAAGGAAVGWSWGVPGPQRFAPPLIRQAPPATFSRFAREGRAAGGGGRKIGVKVLIRFDSGGVYDLAGG